MICCHQVTGTSAQARRHLLFAFAFHCVTVPRRNFCREPRCRGSPAWHTRARLKRAKARRLLRAHHGSAPPMSKTWECGKCGRNNPPHRRKCQTWNCRERGPGQEGGGYWDCGCGCESNFASRSRCRSCGVVRGRYQQQQSAERSHAPVSAEYLCSCVGSGGRKAPCPARTGCNRCPR